jgi:hypothetical protein
MSFVGQSKRIEEGEVKVISSAATRLGGFKKESAPQACCSKNPKSDRIVERDQSLNALT